MTPLHAAVQSGDPILIAIATCCSVDLDVLDSNGWSPICYAIFYADTETAKFLLQSGSKVEKAKTDLITLALYHADPEILELLAAATVTRNVATAFRPVSTRFATGNRAEIAEVLVPIATRKVSRMYREVITV
jgi:hypothetical protein